MLIPAGIARLLGYLVGFVYPSYMSYKALETPGDEDDKQWLTYWVVYSIMNIFESFEFILGWFPMYYELKLIAIVWLVFAQGASWLYNAHIRRFFLEHQETISKVAQEGLKKASELKDQVSTKKD
eukprot:TRINITY_DN2249_c0_g1::TRINITY_DN2249_c0_g1_i1::g.6749::m.6749 TRINITY_DN2249_c0_g1::TRINITY_DN2249_c0_g1_i1::g.6749  ORF type:complete len:125 (+),score=37.55,sp/Q29RM3/REEP5_BOVIN/47.01/5e-28,TB2_DP1_HVA22/PF03134.14/2.2e-30 TRINITY_DN2249_c0_g1_i1:77-451(+)